MSQKIKIFYIYSGLTDRDIRTEWLCQSPLTKQYLDPVFISLSEQAGAFGSAIQNLGYPFYHFYYSGKKNIPSCTFEIYKLIQKLKPKVIHSHLFGANICGLSAAKIHGGIFKIHTRHHGTQYHEYSPHAVWQDRATNYLSDHIIASCKNVAKILHELENVPLNKITTIYHGFVFKDFKEVPNERIQILRSKYDLQNIKGPVIGSISRLVELKGILYTLKAFVEFLKTNPEAVFILANAIGNTPYAQQVKDLLSTIPEKNYRLIPFEGDIFALYKLLDIYVHVPINPNVEAFGLTYIESMAAGVPGVFTLSGIAKEFIEDKKNAIVVNFKSDKEIYNALCELTKNKELKEQIIKGSWNSISQKFDFETMMNKQIEIYRRSL